MEKRKVKTFEDLIVWQKGIYLARRIYLLTSDGSLKRDFGLSDQLQRAAVSISANIAEGFERASSKEYLNFLNIAKGSTGELRSLLRIALEIGYLSARTHDDLRNATTELSSYLSNQMRAIKQRMNR